jgi:SAM-dependent methyltransferase
MQVLDLGCGVGDVSLLAAQLVGETGEVIGIDQSPDSIADAAKRARDERVANVRFQVGDIHDPAGDDSFDAIIARLVLMYVDDPAAVLRTQAQALRPGGLVAPIEFELASARSLPSTPLVTDAVGWLDAAFARAGIDNALGPRLPTVLHATGLQPGGMVGIQPHLDGADGAAILAGIVETALPLIERTGVATADEVNVETLEQRLYAELEGSGALFAHPTLFAAWATADPGA